MVHIHLEQATLHGPPSHTFLHPTTHGKITPPITDLPNGAQQRTSSTDVLSPVRSDGIRYVFLVWITAQAITLLKGRRSPSLDPATPPRLREA